MIVPFRSSILVYVAIFHSVESTEISPRIQTWSKRVRWRPSHSGGLAAAAAAAAGLEVVTKLSGGGDNDNGSSDFRKEPEQILWWRPKLIDENPNGRRRPGWAISELVPPNQSLACIAPSPKPNRSPLDDSHVRMSGGSVESPLVVVPLEGQSWATNPKKRSAPAMTR
jgi:hypothetical protein